MALQPQLHILQMKFEILALFCKYFRGRPYLFNFYENQFTPYIYVSCIYYHSAFLFILYYNFICMPVYCFYIQTYQMSYLFFLILNVRINFVLNYPLPIHVNSNFCLVHLCQFCTTLLYLSLLQKRNRSPKMKRFNENEYRLCKFYAALCRQATVCLLQLPLQKIHE